ncbi:condensin-2 complex subunit H2-like isoform X2 [Amblyomma americanum]
MDGLGGSSQRYRAQDREIEQRYANLLTPIRDLTKNFEIDIAAYLDQYLGELSRTPITYQGGESSINFTQAALLIQGSAFVYGKKVEYLHALVHKMAGEIAHNSLKDHDTQNPPKEGAGTAARRRKDDMQFMMHEDTELADSLDDLPSPRQAARNQAAAQRNQFRRQRRRPLSMVVFDTEKETKLHDLKADVVGYKVDYRLYSGVHLVDCESPHEGSHSQECGRDSDGTSICASPLRSSVELSDDCAPGSPLPEPECPDMIPFSGEIGAFEECPAKPDVEESTPVVPVPKGRQSTLANRVKEERINNEENQGHSFVIVRKLLDPMQEITLKNRPILVRRRARKRPFDQCSSSSSEGDTLTTVIVPIATVWVKGSQYPQLLSKELQLKKKEKIIPGGERFLQETMKALKQAEKERNSAKEGFEETASDVNDDAAAPADDAAAAPPADDSADTPDTPDMPADDDDVPADDGDRGVGLACCANAELPGEAAQGPPPSTESSDKDSYQRLVHTYLQEFHEPLSECQLSDLQKRVAEWETRIRPLLDIEEERESFNIRTYCSRVLDHFSDAPSKQTLYFRQICQGRPVWEVSRYFASTLQLANNYNVELATDGVMEEGMDTLNLTLLSRKQHFHELEEFDSNISTTPSQTARKGKQQGRKRPPGPTCPEDPSDVLRENPVVPDPDMCADPRLPAAVRTTARAKSRMRVVASLAEDSSEGENDENMVTLM